nr:hypothetical protein [Clostridia bacterium]
MKKLTEHIFEIRYKAKAQVIDQRGVWANTISEEMQLPYWKIEENRVLLKDNEDEGKEFAMAGFTNAGYIVKNQPTDNYFKDKVIKYVKILYSLPKFEESLIVTRVGLRIRTCVEYMGNFNELKNRLVYKYYSLNVEAQRLIDAELVDIGANLNFKDQVGNFNTQCGPMVRQQIEEYFRKYPAYPDVGLYYDIDYYIEPNRFVARNDLQKILGKFIENASDKTEKIIKHILG